MNKLLERLRDPAIRQKIQIELGIRSSGLGKTSL